MNVSRPPAFIWRAGFSTKKNCCSLQSTRGFAVAGLAAGLSFAQMPTYEFRCTDCGNLVEIFQRIGDDPLTVCELCGGTLRKVFHPAGIVFKGSGFYATDSRKAKASSGDGKGASGTGSGKDRSREGGSEKSRSEKGGAEQSGSEKGGSKAPPSDAGSKGKAS